MAKKSNLLTTNRIENENGNVDNNKDLSFTHTKNYEHTNLDTTLKPLQRIIQAPKGSDDLKFSLQSINRTILDYLLKNKQAKNNDQEQKNPLHPTLTPRQQPCSYSNRQNELCPSSTYSRLHKMDARTHQLLYCQNLEKSYPRNFQKSQNICQNPRTPPIKRREEIPKSRHLLKSNSHTKYPNQGPQTDEKQKLPNMPNMGRIVFLL